MNETTLLIGVGVLTLILLVIAIIKLASLSKNLARLSEQIPGTGMTAKELAAELGSSIESSFQKYMPQPEKVAGAITTAVESTMKSAAATLENTQKKIAENQEAALKKIADQEKASASGLDKVGASISSTVESALKTVIANVDNLHKKLLDGQDSVLDKWVAHEKNSTAGLANIGKVLETASQQFSAGLTGGSQKMQSSLDDGSKKLSDTLAGLTTKLEAALKDHADKATSASNQLSAQLEKIAMLEKDIDKLLHLQQTTEGTIKSVAASEEFKELVKALRSHLESSDKVLREVAKPRTIRLVEQEG